MGPSASSLPSSPGFPGGFQSAPQLLRQSPCWGLTLHSVRLGVATPRRVVPPEPSVEQGLELAALRLHTPSQHRALGLHDQACGSGAPGPQPTS